MVQTPWDGRDKEVLPCGEIRFRVVAIFQRWLLTITAKGQ